MGQINCHCQHISSDDLESFKHQNHTLPLLATEQTEPTQIFVKMTLTSASKTIDIPLSEARKFTYGSAEDCQHRHNSPTAAHFKMEVRYRNRCGYIKDCGVGLGVFLMKRKVVRRAGSAQIFLSVVDKWVVVRILHSKHIAYAIYQTDTATHGLLQSQPEHQIDLADCKLVIKSDEEGRDFTIRRSDRQEMWMLLGEERRVKAKDQLRLGVEVFEVESVNTYLQSSKVIRKY